jgi:hypothetical protein
VGRVEALGEHLHVDDHVELAPDVAVDDLRRVLPAVVDVVDLLHAALLELPGERLGVERVRREHDGGPVLVSVPDVLLHDERVAVRVLAEPRQYVGSKVAVAIEVLELGRVHVLLDIDLGLDGLRRRHRQDAQVGQLGATDLVDHGPIEEVAKTLLVGLVRANGRRREAEQSNARSLDLFEQLQGLGGDRVVRLVHDYEGPGAGIGEQLRHEAAVRRHHGRLDRREDHVMVRAHRRPLVKLRGHRDEVERLALGIGQIPQPPERLEGLPQERLAVREPEDPPALGDHVAEEPMGSDDRLASAGRQHHQARGATLLQVEPGHLVPGGELVRVRIEPGRRVAELEAGVRVEEGGLAGGESAHAPSTLVQATI